MSVFSRLAARALVSLSLLSPAAAQDLLIDFNSTTQDSGPHPEPGYQSYNAGHEVAADFLAARSYGAFDTTVSLQVTWPDTTNNRVQQMLDRSATNDANWAGQKLDLLTDWIGIDTRVAEGGKGNYDGVTGLPTRLVFRLAGVPAGIYSYRSYHHDTENVHTSFRVELSTDGGTSYVEVPGSFQMTDSTPGGQPASAQTYTGGGNQDPATLPSTVNFNLTAQTGQDVLVRYTPFSNAAGVHRQLLGVNGFELRLLSPPDAPVDIAFSGTGVSRFAPEGTVVGTLSSTDPTPGDTFTYTLVPGAGAENNTDFAIDGDALVVDRQLSEYPVGNSLSVRVRSTDANGGWYEEVFGLAVTNDSDNDGLDDAWEQLHFQDLDETGSGNPDVDGLTNAQEQAAGTDPTVVDSDGDGLSDGAEVSTHQTDPLRADTDGDGLGDREEIEVHFTHPLLADSDGDGYDDALEIEQATDPGDAQDFPPFLIPLRINEILAVNDTGLRDGDGARVDWIEIFNPNPQAVDLTGYRLTDSALEPAKWVFPTASIPAGGYLVVFASGSGVPDALGHLHTNFSLSSAGEYLALSRPDGAVVQAFSPLFPAQYGDISYGRHATDGSPRFFSTPTPGAANGSGFAGVVEAPQVSVPRGFYDDPFALELSCATPLAQIRYTTDGSKPSANAGFIADGSPIPVETTAKIRAIAWRSGWISLPVQTHSYVFVDDVALQPANPPGWPSDWGFNSEVGQIVPSDYAMDPRVVNHTLPGYGIRDALLDIPSVSINLPMAEFIEPPNGIYASPLVRRETECSVEYLPVDGSEGFQANCKVEVHGNSSRRPFRMQKHSLRLSFSSLVGPPKLDYPLFPGSPVDEFNKLVLRACFSDSWGLVSWDAARYRPNDSQYFRDVWMKRSFGAMGQPMSYGRFVHLYVNGLYFGLHDLTERLEDDHFAEHHGGEPEDWEINADFSTGGARWNEMMTIANSADISTPAGYAAILPYLDVENFADYMLLHFYADSEDWPHHNGYAAVNPVSGDGRYRFWVWDQEIALDKFTWNRYNSNPGNNSPGRLFQRLRLNPEFRLLFADRVKKQMFAGGAIRLEGSADRYLEIASWIDKAIVAESARWGDTADTTPYGSTIQQPDPLGNVEHDAYPPAPNFGQPGGVYFTREGSWLVERDHVVNYHLPVIHSTTDSRGLIQELRANGLYPGIDAPDFAQHGGILPPSQNVEISAPLGTIHFTTDGSDPRDAATNLPAATSSVYSAPFPLAAATTVKARARLEDGTWSALLAADFFLEEPVAEFIPGNTAGWNVDANWTSPEYPDGPGKRARILAPAAADRNVDLTAPVTIGEITFEQEATPFRNRVRELAGMHPLTFQATTGDALIRVNGTGTGWAEFELGSECVLASPLTLEVNHVAGNAEFGALRLRSLWSGTGGLNKTGPGMASLTGAGKLYTGPTVVSQGVLAITEPATMTASSSVTVAPGGQLRLTSGGSLEEPRVHGFGGPLVLNSTGRSGVGSGAGLGVLGALRYDPGAGASRALVTNAIEIAGPSGIHVDGAGNELELTGTLAGGHPLTKSGGGLLRLTADSPGYAAAVQVDHGTLDLDGRLGSGIALAGSASLTGHGRCAELSGSGTVALDGTVLRADSLAGVALACVFHGTGSPGFATPATAGNGTLVAGGMLSPPAAVTLYLDVPALLPEDRFRGGLVLPPGSDWSAILPGATAYLPDAGGLHEFDGRTWSAAPGAMFTRVPVTADLGEGPVAVEILEVRVDGHPIGFPAWQAATFGPADLGNPAVSGENAAPFGDGIANLIRYALGASGAGPVALPEFTKAGATATFRFRYDPALYDLVYRVEATDDLGDWSAPVVLFDSSVTPLPPPPDGWLEVTDPTPPPGRRFYRLRVLRP
jgi:autotransporter-associated beta strand protein